MTSVCGVLFVMSGRGREGRFWFTLDLEVGVDCNSSTELDGDGGEKRDHDSRFRTSPNPDLPDSTLNVEVTHHYWGWGTVVDGSPLSPESRESY